MKIPGFVLRHSDPIELRLAQGSVLLPRPPREFLCLWSLKHILRIGNESWSSIPTGVEAEAKIELLITIVLGRFGVGLVQVASIKKIKWW